jgi:hypothetical protein
MQSVAKTKQQAIEDARQAKRLLQDEALTRAFDEIAQQVFDDFASSELGDVDELLRLQAELNGVNALRRRLRIWVDAGMIAEKGAK